MGQADSQAGGAAQPGTMVGRYKILSRLAVGGMAEIYLARQEGPHGFERLCVVKMMQEVYASSDDHVKMFLDEAHIAAQLNHPGITQIYDFGEESGHLYLAMEYLAGESVGEILTFCKLAQVRLPMSHAMRIGSQVAIALDYAHRRADPLGKPLQIVHRDISPDNILVTFEGEVKILDFGIAKAAHRLAQTAVGLVKGKLSYMSPEQALGREIDNRTDVFALGVILFQLAAGRHPFDEITQQTAAALVGRLRFPRASEFANDVPPAIDDIIAQATSVDHGGRTAAAGDLHYQLEEWLRTQPTVSPSDLSATLEQLMPGRKATRQKMVEAALLGDPDVTRVAFAYPPDPSAPKRSPTDFEISVQAPENPDRQTASERPRVAQRPQGDPVTEGVGSASPPRSATSTAETTPGTPNPLAATVIDRGSAASVRAPGEKELPTQKFAVGGTLQPRPSNIVVDLETDETDTQGGPTLVWWVVGASVGLMAVGLLVARAKGLF